MLPQAAAHTDTQPLSIPAAPRRRTRRRGSAIRVLSSIMLGSVVLLILTVVVGMVLGLWRFTVIDTGSMRPTLNPGRCRRPDLRADRRPAERPDRRLSPTRRAAADGHPPRVLHRPYEQPSHHPDEGRRQQRHRPVACPHRWQHRVARGPEGAKGGVSGGVESAATCSLRRAQRHRDPDPKHAAGLDLAAHLALFLVFFSARRRSPAARSPRPAVPRRCAARRRRS